MESEAHMASVLERAKPMFDQMQLAQQSASFAERLEANRTLLSPNESDLDMMDELSDLDAKLVVLEDEVNFLRFQRQLLEWKMKARIGGALGIDRVAMWESTSRRNFCLATFRQR